MISRGIRYEMMRENVYMGVTSNPSSPLGAHVVPAPAPDIECWLPWLFRSRPGLSRSRLFYLQTGAVSVLKIPTEPVFRAPFPSTFKCASNDYLGDQAAQVVLNQGIAEGTFRSL
jgi:hypothetical protein